MPRDGEELSRHPSLEDRFDPAIRIVDYDPEWPLLANAELARIKVAVGEEVARLEHVGSTSISGIAAKPIIDLQLSVREIGKRSAFIEPLSSIGYLFVPDPESPDYHFFAKPTERPRSYHLHVCEAGSNDEFRHLAVRNFLRAHPEESLIYARLKRVLAARSPYDRLAYIEGKASFMKGLEERALYWANAVAPKERQELWYHVNLCPAQSPYLPIEYHIEITKTWDRFSANGANVIW